MTAISSDKTSFPGKSRGGYHDNECHIGGPHRLQGLGLIGGSAVVESRPGDVEPARRVDGQLAVDEVLVAFAFQDCSEGVHQRKEYSPS